MPRPDDPVKRQDVFRREPVDEREAAPSGILSEFEETKAKGTNPLNKKTFSAGW